MATRRAAGSTTVKMITVLAIVPVNYDGDVFSADTANMNGAEFDCRETDLAQLLAVNAVRVVDDAPDSATVGSEG